VILEHNLLWTKAQLRDQWGLSSSSKSKASSEAMSLGTLVFSFTLHYCFMGIMGRIALKCSSLSFSVASSLSFCALVLWILLLWLGVRPSGQQRCVGAISGAVVLEFPF
jgi:hypothetical protein